MTANVNKTSLTLDDQLVLTVEIQGASGNMITPQLPSLPAFNVYAQEVEQSTINFQTTTVFRYLMTPRFVGRAQIGSVTFTYRNKTYKTDPIPVAVYRSAGSASAAAQSGSGQTAPAPATARLAAQQTPTAELPPMEASFVAQATAFAGKDFFLLAAVNNRRPYVNQTDVLAVRFYAAKPIYGDESPYIAPTVTNLFMDDLGRSEGTQVLNGRMYSYNEFRYSVSGVTPGEAVIGSAMAKYLTGSGTGISILDHMFGAGASGEMETAKSNPLKLFIQPLPQQGKPASFYGAVGQGYTISAAVDRQEAEVGDAINLTVKVQGPGNLKSTKDILFPALNGFKVYDAATSSSTLPSNGGLRGFKAFKTVLVPTAEGTYTLPPIEWSYFDPQSKTYRTIATRPLDLTILPSTKTGAGYDFTQATPTQNTGFEKLGKDINYLKTAFAPTSGSALETASKLWPLNWLAVALLLAAGAFALVDKKTLAYKRALSKARAQLKAAQNEEAVSDAVSDYLQTKIKLSTASQQLRHILQVLKQHGAKDASIKQFNALWQYLEAARFAPSAKANVAQAAELAAQLLKTLDGELK